MITRAAVAEDGGALVSLCEVIRRTCTSAFETLGDSTGSDPGRWLGSRAL